MRRARIEHILSALPPLATGERTFGIGSSVPWQTSPPAFVNRTKTKILAAHRSWSSDRSGNIIFPIIPNTQFLRECNAYGHSPCCCCREHNNLIKEMCHEEIPHRDRVDLAAYHPGSRECQRGPCFAVEPRIWRQRLLTSSRTNQHLCSLSRRLSWQCNGTAPDRDRRRR